jgi:NitT/TauT family transport system permease protein
MGEVNAVLKPHTPKRIYLPLCVLVLFLALWALLARLKTFPESAFPTPAQVLQGFLEEQRTGRLFDDLIASLFRVGAGFILAVALGVPLGLLLGLKIDARYALLPSVNFFRSLSPLAWIPFAILWFGIGDVPAIFLIFMAAFFPIVLTTLAAVANIPTVTFRVARDYDLTGFRLLSRVIVPAILPQVLTALRVTAGLAWVVVVAAEMIAGRDGLGFLIWDARNALRPDLVVVGMIFIGTFGVLIDRLLVQLTQLPGVRWGYDR